MTRPPSRSGSRRVRAELPAILLAGVSGAAAFNLAPLLLPAAAEAIQIDERRMGWLMTAEIGGLALASLISLLLIPRLGCRLLCLLGLSNIMLGNLVSQSAQTYEALVALRFATGLLGDGLAYSGAIVLLGQRTNPTAAFALLSLCNMIYTSATLALFPTLSPADTWSSITFVLTATALAGLVATPLLPRPEPQKPARFPLRGLPQCAGILSLLGLFAYAINLGALWSYVEPLGNSIGLDARRLGAYLSISLTFQAFGSLSAVALSTRCRRETLLLLTLMMQLVALGQFSSADSATGFLVAVSLWGYSWNLGIANLLGLIAHIEAARPLLPLAPGIEALGIAAGPALVALSFVEGSRVPVLAVAAIAVSLGICAMLLSAWRSARIPPAPADGDQSRPVNTD